MSAPTRTGFQRAYADGTLPAADLPANTLDPRYHDCAGQHHTACICREAMFAEELTEVRGEMRRMHALIRGALLLLQQAGPEAVGEFGAHRRDRFIADAVELLNIEGYR